LPYVDALGVIDVIYSPDGATVSEVDSVDHALEQSKGADIFVYRLSYNSAVHAASDAAVIGSTVDGISFSFYDTDSDQFFVIGVTSKFQDFSMLERRKLLGDQGYLLIREAATDIMGEVTEEESLLQPEEVYKLRLTTNIPKISISEGVPVSSNGSLRPQSRQGRGLLTLGGGSFSVGTIVVNHDHIEQVQCPELRAAFHHMRDGDIAAGAPALCAYGTFIAFMRGTPGSYQRYIKGLVKRATEGTQLERMSLIEDVSYFSQWGRRIRATDDATLTTPEDVAKYEKALTVFGRVSANVTLNLYASSHEPRSLIEAVAKLKDELDAGWVTEISGNLRRFIYNQDREGLGS
jgi:hypothetical protein